MFEMKKLISNCNTNFSLQIHELWWSQFCVGLDEFQDLNPEEKTIVLKNVPLADRLCQALYLGPGAETNLIGIVKVYFCLSSNIVGYRYYYLEHDLRQVGAGDCREVLGSEQY